MITLLYFARLREELGSASEQLDLPGGVDHVEGLMEWLRQRGGVWREQFGGGRPVLAAVNQELAAADTAVCDGDEIAFFPPVTGG